MEGQITICGGGNQAHASVARIGHMNPKLKINVFTRKPAQWKQTITAYTDKSSWKAQGTQYGNINKVSDDPAQVIPGSRFCIIAGPSHIHGELLKKIAPYVEKDAFVGTLYGQGGFDLQAKAIFGHDLEKKNITLFAYLNVPFICKIIEYGNKVNIIGPKIHLYCASFPVEKVHEISNYTSILYYIPTIIIPNFITITLTPSNQIIHPARTVALFKNWDGKTTFAPSEIPRLYDIDEESALEMELLDDEIQSIRKKITLMFPQIDLSNLLPMKDRIIKQYGDQISDKRSMKTVFSTNKGYDILTYPVKQVGDRVMPNVDSRFFWEDVPYGLCILKNVADILGVKVPNTERIIQWHQKFMGVKFLDENGILLKDNLNLTGEPAKYGIFTPYDLLFTSMPKQSAKL